MGGWELCTFLLVPLGRLLLTTSADGGVEARQPGRTCTNIVEQDELQPLHGRRWFV